jgi:hypothetical protein
MGPGDGSSDDRSVSRLSSRGGVRVVMISRTGTRKRRSQHVVDGLMISRCSSLCRRDDLSDGMADPDSMVGHDLTSSKLCYWVAVLFVSDSRRVPTGYISIAFALRLTLTSAVEAVGRIWGNSASHRSLVVGLPSMIDIRS